MTLTNEQQAQITQRAKEKAVLGAAGAASSRSCRRQSPQPQHCRANSKGARGSELISGFWKEKQSDSMATLHVGSDTALAVVSTKILIRLCGLPVRPEECEDNRWGEEPSEHVNDPFRGLEVYPVTCADI